MRKKRRNDDLSPELPLLWEQIPETSHHSVKSRKVLSPELLEEISEDRMLSADDPDALQQAEQSLQFPSEEEEEPASSDSGHSVVLEIAGPMAENAVTAPEEKEPVLEPEISEPVLQSMDLQMELQDDNYQGERNSPDASGVSGSPVVAVSESLNLYSDAEEAARNSTFLDEEEQSVEKSDLEVSEKVCGELFPWMEEEKADGLEDFSGNSWSESETSPDCQGKMMSPEQSLTNNETTDASAETAAEEAGKFEPVSASEEASAGDREPASLNSQSIESVSLQNSDSITEHVDCTGGEEEIAEKVQKESEESGAVPTEVPEEKDVEEVNEEKKSLILESAFKDVPEEEHPQEIFDVGPLGVGERLRSLRCQKELTLQQVAASLCTSQTNIEEMENGRKRADHYGKLLLERLCKVYDIPSEELLQDFIRECPAEEEEEEEAENAAGPSHRHDYVFGESAMPETGPRKERMGIPAVFLTVVIIGVLLILLGAWGRQKYQLWQEEQEGKNFRLDMLQLLPEEVLPEKTLPVPKG